MVPLAPLTTPLAPPVVAIIAEPPLGSVLKAAKATPWALATPRRTGPVVSGERLSSKLERSARLSSPVIASPFLAVSVLGA